MDLELIKEIAIAIFGVLATIGAASTGTAFCKTQIPNPENSKKKAVINTVLRVANTVGMNVMKNRNKDD